MAENMEALPEEVLIQRAQAQDYDAMDALMQRYKGIVRKRARSLFIIGGDQDDLMQEGMIGLYKAIRDYQPDVVLVMRDDLTCLNTGGNGSLE